MSQLSNDIDIKKLIRQYKRHECLWNINSPDYKNKLLKQKAWLDIANYFQKNANEVKRKVQYLRAAYVHEKRRVEASRRSVHETPHTPVLFYYKDLDFLENMVIWRKFENDKTHSNLTLQNVQDKEFITIESKEDDYLQEPELNCKIETYDESEVDNLSSDQKLVSSPEIPNSPPQASKFAKINNGAKLKSDDTSPLTSTATAPEPKFLYFSFGKTIALQLQQLPLEDALLAMSEIQHIVTQKSLEHIRSLQKDYETWSQSESEESYSEFIVEADNDLN